MKNRNFSYFLNWILLGAFFGFAILLFQGNLHLTFIDGDSSGKIQNDTQTISYSDAVAKAAPSVVYIKALTYAKTPAINGTSLVDRFFGSNSKRL